MRIRQETFFSLELPYRERLVLERTVYEGGSGPRVAITSGIHGDELEGLYVCHRLAAWLEGLAKERPEALLGQVELYPALNPLGLDTLRRGVPIYEVDLNRCFPGHAEGMLPHRVADAVMRAGFPPVHLAPINFEALYQQQLAQMQQPAPAVAN